MFKSLQQKAHKALTLIEALLFLGIAAVVIVGAVVFYNNASGSANLNAAVAQVQAVATGIRGLHSGQATFGTTVDLTPLTINAGIAPSGTVQGTTMRNPWGGEVRVVGRDRFFTIQMDQIPRDNCVRLLGSGMVGDGSIVAVHRVAAMPSGTAAPTGAPLFAIPNSGVPSSTQAGVAATVAGANTACAAGNNTLVFWVR